MRSRRNNTTLTRKIDKWNTHKVWLIKRYADGHYAINQEVGGRVFYSSYQRSNQGADRRDLRALLRRCSHERDQRHQSTPPPLLCRGSFPATLEETDEPTIVEASIYRLNAVAVTAFLLDGPETLLRHIGLDERDTDTTKHEIDDLVTVVHITREEAIT